ncbi:MAG: LPS export ABC transporter permease LptG [Acidaminococcaceae bacterium]|nr:LPS export ABC transporter permease LptG [Acidaminococcaceae bacterium]
MKLRLLDKYVLKELLYPFIFGVASFSSIFIASSMLFKIVKYITTYGASAYSVARLFMYSMPEVINYTFPMSVLLATLMAFGKLSGSSEIVAMKSGGVSYYRIVAPVVALGFVVSMFSVIWAEKVVPPSKYEARRILEEEIRGDVKPKTQEHVVIKTLRGDTQRITYARSFDEKTGVMNHITIEEFTNNRLSRVQTAETAKWENASWTLENGTVFTVDEKNNVSNRATFTKQVIPLNTTPREISWEQKDADQMTLGELRGYINVLERQKQPTSYYWTEIFMRFAIPLASFVFALLGAPLGTQRQRSGSSIGLGISVIVIFVYYGIMAFTTGLGKGGVIPPFLGAMSSNIVCLAAGILLLKRADY